MGSHNQSTETRIAATCLVAFAFLLFGMVIFEAIMSAALEAQKLTWERDFLQKSKLRHVMPYFLNYLVIGGVGLFGTVGLAQVYGSSHRRITAEVVKLAGLAYFAINYWLWAAMWVVQYKITLLTDVPTNPPQWLMQAFKSSDAFWSLAGWGGQGPAIVLFLGLAWLLSRGARLLPRSAAAAFLVMGVVHFVMLVYVGLHGAGLDNTSHGFAFLLDMTMAFGRIVAFLLAGAALYTEKGIFARSVSSRTRVR